MRKANLAAAALVLGALALALLLVPTQADLGAHLTSDHESIKARGYLERSLAETGPRSEVVVPLAKIRSEQGEHHAALALLGQLDVLRFSETETTLRRNELREAGMQDAYARELEVLRDREPTPGVLAELAQIYGSQQLLELQADALDALLALRPQDTELLRSVAHLHAQIGHKNRSLELMSDLWQRKPSALTAADFEVLVALRIELDPSDSARILVEAFLADVAPALRRVDVARRFYAAGRMADVRQLLDAEVRSGSADPRAVETWTRAMLALGEAQEAAAVLATHGAGRGRTAALLCEAALSQGDMQTALDVARQAQFRDIDARVLLWLASAAANVHAVKTVRAVLAAVGPEALADDPVGAANLYWQAQHKADALKWANRARVFGTLNPQQRRWLAELYLAMNLRNPAAQVLARLDPASLDTDESALQVATLWWRTGESAHGIKVLDAHAAPSAGLTAGRVLLLAAAGRWEEALSATQTQHLQAGLQGLPRGAVRDWLQALAAEALSKKYPKLAVFAYQQLLALQPGQRSLQLGLAAAQAESGEPLTALETLRHLPQPLLAVEKPAYRQVLLAAFRAKVPVLEELKQAATAYLAAADLRDAEAQSWVHLLLELGATREAMPYVARLGASEGGAWAGKQVELLKGLGATDEVAALWRIRGLDASRPAQERLDAAGNLLLAGNRQDALRIYQQVAETEAPDGPVVQQLLHLWGPRPGPAAVAWLTQRARQATGAAQVPWLRHLLWVGAPAAVLTLLGSEPPEGDRFDVALDALVQEKQWKSLAALTEQRVPGLRDARLVLRLAEHCAAHGQKRAAELAYTRLVELEPRNAGALRYLAQATSASPARAERYWQAYFALAPATQQPPSWRDRAAFADVLLSDTSRQTEGKQQLEMSLRLLAAETLPQGERDRESGRLLARLGRAQEAVPPLERALATRPCDDALRADLVAALMAAQELEKARTAVDPPARCEKREDASAP